MRFKSGMSAISAVLTLLFVIALGLSNSAFAVPYTWRDDPSSTVDPSNIQRSQSGNTITFSNFQAVNLTNQALPSLGLIQPWIFSKFGDITYSFNWSNAADGWVNNNVEGTSLLITLDNFTNRLLFGKVADGTGAAPLDPTRTVNGVSETIKPGDLVPFLDLGAFAANEMKAFSLVFTYHFGDGRILSDSNPPLTIGFFNTVSPIPEPSALALLGIGLIAFRFSRSSAKLPRQTGLDHAILGS